jgi:hypothetical protein
MRFRFALSTVSVTLKERSYDGAGATSSLCVRASTGVFSEPALGYRPKPYPRLKLQNSGEQRFANHTCGVTCWVCPPQTLLIASDGFHDFFSPAFLLT